MCLCSDAERLKQKDIHPFAIGDLLNDSSNNSAVDVLKHTIPAGLQRMDDLVPTNLEEVIQFPATGVDFFQTNLVNINTNYQTGHTAYRTYVFGQNGVIAVRLGARGDNAIDNGDWRNLTCNIEQSAPRSVADPSGLIPGWTSYKVHYTATLPPDSTQRLRYFDATSGIS